MDVNRRRLSKGRSKILYTSVCGFDDDSALGLELENTEGTDFTNGNETESCDANSVKFDEFKDGLNSADNDAVEITWNQEIEGLSDVNDDETEQQEDLRMEEQVDDIKEHEAIPADIVVAIDIDGFGGLKGGLNRALDSATSLNSVSADSKESKQATIKKDDSETDKTEIAFVDVEEEQSTQCPCGCMDSRSYEFNKVNCECQRKPLLQGNRDDSGVTASVQRRYSCGDRIRNDGPESQHNSKVCCAEVRHRSRSKSETLSPGGGVELEFAKSRCECTGYFSGISIKVKNNMASVLCQCILLLVLCICGGVIVVSSRHTSNTRTNSKSHDHHVPVSGSKSHHHSENRHSSKSSESTNIIMDLPFREASLEEIESHISRSSSAADVLKLFFNEPNLTEEQINSIMYMKSRGVIHPVSDTSGEYMFSDADTDLARFKTEAFEHYQSMQKHPYSECMPQPVMQRVELAYSDSRKVHLPRCTVVNRCQNTTSCCPPGRVCGPKKEGGIEIVTRRFMVFETNPGSDKLVPSRDYTAEIAFENHVSCECHDVKINSNCHLDCPRRFRKQRPGVNCECTCRGGARFCHRIQKGWSPLDEEDLVCIKEGNCIEPKCSFGDFDVNSGFCPSRNKG